MSLAIQDKEFTNQPAQAVSPTCSLNGKDRLIEKIQVGLDDEIEHYRSDSEYQNRKTLKLLIGAVTSVFIATLSAFLTILAPPVGIACLTASIISFGVCLILFPEIDEEKAKADHKMKELMNCKRDLQKEEFRSYLNSFGDRLTIYDLLNAHRNMNAQKNLDAEMAALRQKSRLLY